MRGTRRSGGSGADGRARPPSFLSRLRGRAVERAFGAERDRKAPAGRMQPLRARRRRPHRLPLVTERFDLAIVGSGFGGSLLAAIARRIGLTVVLLEKGSHPRFAIGESTSPLANILLETLAARHGLPEIAALAKWG